MSRLFARLFNSETQKYSIIAKDDDDDYWFVYLEDPGFNDTEIVNALNASAR